MIHHSDRLFKKKKEDLSIKRYYYLFRICITREIKKAKTEILQ